MSEEEAGLYKGNGREDEGMPCSKGLTTKWMPHIPTTLMTLSQPVRLGMFLRRHIEPSLHRSVHSEITSLLSKYPKE